MTTTDPRVDLDIERAAPFAPPVLMHLRAVMLAACPGRHETVKRDRPFFMHGHRLIDPMAAFKLRGARGALGTAAPR